MNCYESFIDFLSLGGEMTKAINNEILYESCEYTWVEFINLLNKLEPKDDNTVTLTDDHYKSIYKNTVNLNYIFAPRLPAMIQIYISNFLFKKYGYLCKFSINESYFKVNISFCNQDMQNRINKPNYEINSRIGFEQIFYTGCDQYLNIDYLSDILYDPYLETVCEIKKAIEKIDLSKGEVVITVNSVDNTEIIHLLEKFKILVIQILPYFVMWKNPIFGMMRIVAHLGIAHIENQAAKYNFILQDSETRKAVIVQNIETGAHVKFSYS
jgi:hypothetical protein